MSIDSAVLVTPENKKEVLANTGFFFKLLANVGEMLAYGKVVFHLPDGRMIAFDSGNASDQIAEIKVRNYAMASRILFGGIIGFYKSYADHQWDTPNLAQTLYVLAMNADHIQSTLNAHPVLRTLNQFAHGINKNTKSGSKKNIMAHYDLGNEFYEKWLDSTMTYSSALFQTPDQSLSDAQTSKYASLASKLSLTEGDSVLEIGSGWGGFAEYAAKEHGAKITGLTISPAQYEYAQERMFREGLNEKVEIRLQDYRDVQGSFDKIASIEMFEAVGKEYWPVYFSKIHDSLKSNGSAALQIITIADRFYENYDKGSDFIQQYVFPGGMLPSPSILEKQISKAGLKLNETISFGADYAKTLSNWHKTFLQVWDDLVPLGFDDRFKTLWQFYLAYCEAGFRAKTTDVCQVSISKA